MSWWRGVSTRVRETLRRDGLDADLDAEIEHHLELEIERLVRGGMAMEAARSEASRRFGSTSTVREVAREEAGFQWLEQTSRDVRFAARGLRRAPGFSVAAVLTLGLGIGATTAIYSVVDAVLLEPLPYPDSHELVRFFEQNSPTNRWNISVVDYQAVRERQSAFADVAALRAGSATFTGRGRAERVAAAWVSADWFRMFGVQPAEGRGFATDEELDGPLTAVVSASFRRRVFGEGQAVGQSITIDGQPHAVIGVLSDDLAEMGGFQADVWPILRLQTPGRRGPFFLRGFARLNPGTTVEEGRADLARISEAIYPLWSDGFTDATARLTPYTLHGTIIGDVGGGLWLLMGAVAGVLLICVANVANLQLVRAAGRDREMSLRASLGASRKRLARQLLAESILLSLVGGVAGMVLAALSVRVLVLSNPSLPRVSEIGLDSGVFAFAAIVSVATGILFGMAPLVHALSRNLASGLKSGGGAGSNGPAWEKVRAVLVTAEFAIALPILAGAGLMLTSLQRLQEVDPGYRPEGLLSARVALPSATYAEPADVLAFWDEALRRIEAIPGVVTAGISTGLPPDFVGITNNFDLLDKPVSVGESEHTTIWNWTGPGFLEALGVPLLEGRMIERRDQGEPPVIVVSRSWAERFYPDEPVLGTRLYSGGDRSEWMTVVGVVDDVKFFGLDASDDAAVYEPYAQAGSRSVNLLVRAAGPGVGIVEASRAAIASLDPDVPLSNIQTMTERLDASTSVPRYWTTLLTLFAVLGLTLAAVGVYGVLSYFVTRQHRMIGIRVALGAPPAKVRCLVVRQGMTRALVGIGVGLVGALIVTRWLETLLFEVSATDPTTLFASAAVLGLVAFAACYLPARRATRIDPLETLRTD